MFFCLYHFYGSLFASLLVAHGAHTKPPTKGLAMKIYQVINQNTLNERFAGSYDNAKALVKELTDPGQQGSFEDRIDIFPVDKSFFFILMNIRQARLEAAEAELSALKSEAFKREFGLE